MPALHSLHVALTAPMLDYVRRQVADGRFANASQMVRAALEAHASETSRPDGAPGRHDGDEK